MGTKNSSAGLQGARRAAAPVAFFVLLAGLLVSMVFSISTKIEPGHIGVIVNNLSGKTHLQLQPGVVYHLPWGLTDVYPLESKFQVYEMRGGETSQQPRGRRGSAPANPTANRVKVKSSDGGDVYMDLTINYILKPDRGIEIARRIGVGDAYKQQLMKAFARSRIRDALGSQTMNQISDARDRTAQLDKVRDTLNEDLDRWGLEVLSVAASNFSFNPKYEELIKERKKYDQDVRNQETAQVTASKEQETEISQATREKNVETRRIEGQLNKRVIEAKGLAEKLVTEAEGKAYAVKISGDQAYAVAEAEAEALESEGLKRAEGIQKLSEAYRDGGIALILEALAAKYRGRQIHGRPYNLESTVGRLRLEESAGAATRATPRKGGGS